MNEDTRKHLELIQNTINRFNANSFQIKGLAITIVTALLGIFSSNSNASMLFIGIGPTLLFWFLDAYYLQIERKLRGIYNDVAGITTEHAVLPYEFPLRRYSYKKYKYWRAFKSKTIALLYLSLILLLLIVGLFFIENTNSCI